MLSRVIGLAFSVSTFSLIMLARELKNFMDITKMSSILYYYIPPFPYISLSAPGTTKHACACHQQYSFYFKR